MIKKIFLILFSVILGCAVFVAYFYFTLDKIDVNRDIKFGVTFTPKRAADLGLDWREAYLSILDDLNTRRLRIAAYWNRIEDVKGEYDFSELDWLISEAEKRDAKIILALGRRVPGWPECHEPEWLRADRPEDDSVLLLEYMENVINRYKNSSGIWAWQIENEPFLDFGICPAIGKRLLEKEINVVRSLDNRPIIVTESGEFGKWWKVAPFGDILGTTLYRSVHHKTFGYITYPIPPSFFRLKSLLVREWTKPEDIIVIELQGEPWVEDPPINKASLEEQYITMSPEKLNNVLEYVRHTDFNEFYFWGSEWWYWMKKEGNDEIWNIAKELF